ncbi:GNAT family N-acetyltransferase [Nocardia sp. XZ_19_385]|uniref:GNAT family N-acetyltransferase n=1 Tax=Nocardia sp. XZ_19_385 TaxID=2769488 RepID=UPI00188E3337|nr:GNAT family protein [Nocardia sp. XZ_19_385]
MPDGEVSLSRIRLGPVRLHNATVVLRPPRIDDYAQWRRIRLRDQRYIEPFWTTSPLDWAERHTGKLWVREVFDSRADARAGRRLGTVIEVDGRFAGQIELGSLAGGTGELGVWVDARLARHGLGGLAVAMMLDFGFRRAGLHRITAPISPANKGTAAGAAALGMRREALMARYFDVGGERRDHDLWAVLASDIPAEGATANWIARHSDGDPVPEVAEHDVDSLSRTAVALATARYYAGRTLHAADPLRATAEVRLSDPGHPEVVVRTRRFSDWTRWRDSRVRARDRIAPETTAAEWNSRHRHSRWVREHLGARAGLHSPAGLVLAIEVDGVYTGEARLFELDMFDRNARMFVWTEPPQDRIRETVTRLLIAHGFEKLGLRRIATEIEPEDTVSADIAGRAGMIREGRMRQFVGPTGRRADYDLWAVTSPA